MTLGRAPFDIVDQRCLGLRQRQIDICIPPAQPQAVDHRNEAEDEVIDLTLFKIRLQGAGRIRPERLFICTGSPGTPFAMGLTGVSCKA